MTHIIAEPCIGTKDTSCVEVCPVDCIHPLNDSDKFGDSEMLYIDPDTCIDCGLCVDERGVGEAIEGVRRGTPGDMVSMAGESDNTLVIGTR